MLGMFSFVYFLLPSATSELTDACHYTASSLAAAVHRKAARNSTGTTERLLLVGICRLSVTSSAPKRVKEREICPFGEEGGGVLISLCLDTVTTLLLGNFHSFQYPVLSVLNYYKISH